MASNSTCDPSRSQPMPSSFDGSSTPLCGASLAATTVNISACCTGPAQVFETCFQYCTPQNKVAFGGCVVDLANGSAGHNGLLTVCNKAASDAGGGPAPPSNAAANFGQGQPGVWGLLVLAMVLGSWVL